MSLSGSYQERDFGYSQVGVPNGWRSFRGDSTAYGTIPQPGAPGSENITNRPGPNDIYSVPSLAMMWSLRSPEMASGKR